VFQRSFDRRPPANFTSFGTVEEAGEEPVRAPLTVARALAVIGAGARRLGRARRVAIYVRDAAGTLNCAWSTGLSRTFLARVLTFPRPLTAQRLMERVRPERLRLPGGRLVQATKPFLIPDAQAFPSDSPFVQLARQSRVYGIGFWPLTYDGRVQAVITGYYNMPAQWSEPEQEIFAVFCWHASTILQNARLSGAQTQRAAELEALHLLSRRLRVARAPAEMYPILVKSAMRALRAHAGILSLLTQTGPH
jgi:GAF domain-containing protein